MRVLTTTEATGEFGKSGRTSKRKRENVNQRKARKARTGGKRKPFPALFRRRSHDQENGRPEDGLRGVMKAS